MKLRRRIAYALACCAGGSLMANGQPIGGLLIWLAAAVASWDEYMGDEAA